MLHAPVQCTLAEDACQETKEQIFFFVFLKKMKNISWGLMQSFPSQLMATFAGQAVTADVFSLP